MENLKNYVFSKKNHNLNLVYRSCSVFWIAKVKYISCLL